MNISKISFGDYTAEINLSRGANCISLRNKKYNASVLREPDYSKEIDNPFLYGMPILFPVNRIEDGRFEFEGRQYTFPITDEKTNCHVHGFLHQAEFELVEKSEQSVKCKYDSDELYGYFPHKFSVEISYSLNDDGLTQETSIHNFSDTNMPVFLGFHTTFNIPFVSGASGENVFVYAQISDEIERDAVRYLPTGRVFQSDKMAEQFKEGKLTPCENKISKHYKADKDGIMELLDVEKRVKIVYTNDEKFGWRLFYNGDGNGFVCLEPQTCVVNCANSKLDPEDTGFDCVPPSSFKKYVSKISVEEF